MRRSRRIRVSLLAFAAFALAQCGGSNDTSGPSLTPANLALSSGDGQFGIVGQALTLPLAVLVTDASNQPVFDVRVTFAVTAGGGSLSDPTANTNAQGVAQVSWTLGQTPGAANDSATATLAGVTGSPVSFSASAAAGPIAQLSVVSGDLQSGEVGQTLPVSLVVRARDTFGNLASGLLAWSTTGGGRLSASSTATDAQGLATVVWTLGNTVVPGAQTVNAQANAASAPFGATALLTTGTLTLSSPASPIGQGGAALAPAPAVLVKSGANAAVAGVTVNWQVASGGGSVSSPTSTTDAQGHATIGWTLGNVGGAQDLQATVAGVTPGMLTLTAQAVVPSPSSLTGQVSVTAGFLAPPAPASRGRGFNFFGLSSPRGAAGGGSAEELARRSHYPPGMQGQEYTPDELIVKFRPMAVSAAAGHLQSLADIGTAQVAAQEMAGLLASHLAAGRVALTGVSPVILAARIKVADPAKLDSVAQALSADPSVAGVTRNGWLRVHGWAVPGEKGLPVDAVRSLARAPFGNIPNDPNYPNQSWHYALIDLPRAWSITTGSSGIIVAVLDNGIRGLHGDYPMLAANLRTDGYDFVSTNAEPLCKGGTIDNADDGDDYDPDPTIPDDWDPNGSGTCLSARSQVGGHGIHTSGTVGAVGNDNSGVLGVNWTVSIRPVRVLGLNGGSTFDVAQGILYASGLPASDGSGGVILPPVAGPARVINMSLGGGCPGVGVQDILHDAVIAATNPARPNGGVLIVASAGNDGTSTPSCPAAYPEVLSVSAVGADTALASYSSFGNTIDIAGPGGDFDDGAATGDGTFGIYSTTCDFTVSPCTPNLARYQGTSMAAPHVTGVAALILAADPSLTAAQLRTRLTQYAVDIGAPGADDQFGAGLVNARNSLTQSLAPPRRLFVRLYNSATGGIVAEQQAAGDGTFTFNALADGSYYVFAGEDENGDGLFGLPDRRWGAFGGSATPTPVAVSSVAGGFATFAIGLPIETGPNSRLMVGGAIAGAVGGANNIDVFAVQIPAVGQYTFETSGYAGAYCRFALNVNTTMALLDVGGLTLASGGEADDIGGNNFCSLITLTLAPGSYSLVLTPGPSFGVGSPIQSGRYIVQARSGP